MADKINYYVIRHHGTFTPGMRRSADPSKVKHLIGKCLSKEKPEGWKAAPEVNKKAAPEVNNKAVMPGLNK